MHIIVSCVREYVNQLVPARRKISPKSKVIHKQLTVVTKPNKPDFTKGVLITFLESVKQACETALAVLE